MGKSRVESLSVNLFDPAAAQLTVLRHTSGANL